MRSSIIALVLVSAACSGGGGSTDLALDAASDLWTRDSAGALPKTGCKGYIQCLLDCGNDMTCSGECDKNVTTQGKQKFQQAIACAQNWCLGTNDLGSGDCTLNAAMTMLVDPPGAPAKTCSSCLNNSLAALFGDVCKPTTDRNCNPAMCAGPGGACQASTP